MTEQEQQIEAIVAAKRYLSRWEYTGDKGFPIFRGVSLKHFNAEELRKIVTIALGQVDQAREFHETTISRFKTFADGWRQRAMEKAR